MRIVTNQKLIARNRKLAQYLFFASFGLLIVGLFASGQQTASMANDDMLLGFFAPLILIIVAFVVTMISVRMTNLWMREPRPEVIMKEGLKGLSNNSVLYHYYHKPAQHVLIAPQGVFALTTRFQNGNFSVNGDDWKTHRSAVSRITSLFRFEDIGNPSEEAVKNAKHVETLLASIAPGVKVQPVVVFTDPRANITIENSTVPVLFGSEKREPNLTTFMREVRKTQSTAKTLTADQIKAFEAATLAGN